MELRTSKRLLTAIPLVLGLAMMGPQMAPADDDKDGKDNDREFTVCKKFVFFDKIIFEFKHELFDIKVAGQAFRTCESEREGSVVVQALQE